MATKYQTLKHRSASLIIPSNKFSNIFQQPHLTLTVVNHVPIPLFLQEALKRGARINVICPSCVETDLLRAVTDKDPVMKQAVDAMGVQT